MFCKIKMTINFSFCTNIREKGGIMSKTVGMIVGIFLLVGCCGMLLYHMENYEEGYYSIIDNQKMKELSTDDNMKYESMPKEKRKL